MQEYPSVLQASRLVKSFPARRNALGLVRERFFAVDEVDLTVGVGVTVGVVGESGSGKTTLGQLVARLLMPDSGSIELAGTEISRASGRALRQLRTAIQVVFQDPYSALDPTKSVGHAVTEPLVVHQQIGKREMPERAASLLDQVGLDPGLVDRHPGELSGGQRQRVCIGRALALSPRLLVADEPTSALDMSTQSEILNLLLDLQQDRRHAILLVSHDFAVIRHLAHRVVVMYMGRIVEEGSTEEITRNPLHPYTRALLSAVPTPDPAVQRHKSRTLLPDGALDSGQRPSGCAFRSRCPMARPECASIDPGLITVDTDRRVACLLYGEQQQDLMVSPPAQAVQARVNPAPGDTKEQGE